MIAGQDAFQLGGHVPASLKADSAEISPIANSEVVEGAEQSFLERLPKPHLGSDSVVEPVQDLAPICSFRRRGEA